MCSLSKYLLSVAFCGWFVLAGHARAQTILVNGSQTNQIMEGFGVNLNYQGWTNTDLEPVIDALVDQANMTLFRVVFDNTDWEGTNDNGNPDVMNWAYYNTIYSSPRFQQLWGVIGYLNQKGIANGAIFNFQGLCPGWMGFTELNAGFEDEWAEMIVSLLYYARNTEHLQFNLIEPINEPDSPPQGFSLTGGYYQCVTMLHDLAVKLDTNGMSDIRFTVPDLAWTDTNFMAAIMSDAVVMAKVSHFGIHGYLANGYTSTGVYNFIKQSAYPNRTFWMTEVNMWCPGCEAGTTNTYSYNWAFCEGTVQYLLPHLANGASAGMIWEGYDGIYFLQGTKWSLWGLLGVNDTNAVDKTYTPRKNFYTMSQISKYVLPGAYCIGLTNNAAPFAQLMAFWQPATGQFTITGVNTDTGSGPDPLPVTLTSLPAISSLQLIYTDPNSNLVQLATVPVTNGSFNASIPANCVFTLVGNGAITLITHPLAGAQFNAPAAIPVQAYVSPGAGAIGRVDFFCGSTNIGTATSPPFGIVWSNMAPGSYVLTARASNTLGAIIVSPPVTVTVAGPLARINISPLSVALAPFATQNFSALGVDALGLSLNPQPNLSWSATGGTIGSNGLFTAGGVAGGTSTVFASNNSVVGSAQVSILPDLALTGIGYTWYSMTNSSQNSPIAAAPGINDGNLLTDVPLVPGGSQEPSPAWEAAGVIWNSPQVINQVNYVNGSLDQYSDGVFSTNFALQFSPDGSTWTNAGPQWSVSPAYAYDSAASADVSFNFTGGQATALGVRGIGQVHAGSGFSDSWVAFATEVQAFAYPSPAVLQARFTASGIVISWSGSLTNYVLESTTNRTSPGIWFTITNAPQTVGNQQQIVVTPVGGQQLFRLRQQ